MKNVSKFFLMAAMLPTFAAQAQRGGRFGGGDHNGGGVRTEQRNTRPAESRQANVSYNHQQNTRQSQATITPQQNTNTRFERTQRNNVTDLSNNQQRFGGRDRQTNHNIYQPRPEQSRTNQLERNTQQRNGFESRNRNDYRYSNSLNYYRPLQSYNRWADYRHPYTYIGYHYNTLYRPRFVPYLGMNYYYSGGFFYRPYNNYFEVVLSPVGIRVRALPFGFLRMYVGPRMYYYYGGTYYDYKDNYYQVVDAPLGSQIPELPSGTKVVVINGHKYFELNGTYYQETVRDNGEIWYTIAGKNGSLNTDVITTREAAPEIGDIVTDLPENCKAITLNNEKYYVSPDGLYFQEMIIDGAVNYKIVAKPGE